MMQEKSAFKWIRVQWFLAGAFVIFEENAELFIRSEVRKLMVVKGHRSQKFG